MKNKKVDIYFLIAAIVLIGAGVLKVFLPFLATLLISFIFWQLFNSTYKFLEVKIKSRRLASLATCVLVFLIIVLPFFTIGGIAADEAVSVYKKLAKESDNTASLQEDVKSITYNYLRKIGLPQEKFEQSFASIDLKEATQKAASVTAEILQQAYRQISQFVFLSFVMLFTLYYLFLDGEKLIKYLFRLSPLGNKEELLIWERFLSMNRATIKGTLIIGVVQGILGGLAFWILGIGSPAFWGVVMGIFSVLPLIGPVAVWVPAALWLIITGAWIEAVILIFIGAFIIGSVDNFLRPKLIGNDTELHPVLILIGTFGGIVEFGIMGFIIGPLLITIFLTLFEILEKKYMARNS